MTSEEHSEFLLRAVHDLKGAVRSMRAPAESLLKNQEAAGDTGERLGFIVQGARRIDLLADGLAAYAIALQTTPAAFQTTSLGVLLRGVLARLERELRSNLAEVSYGSLPRVTGDPDRLMQLLENLIRNAIVHRGEAPPRIQIDAERQPEAWLIAVRDNGLGVEEPYLEAIFRPFERLNGREHPGLGLAACREIVARHGGRMWAESASGTGLTIFFTLPADSTDSV